MAHTDDSLMTFGKYQGQKLANVPASYLMWLFDNGRAYPDLKKYILENKDALQKEIDENKSDLGNKDFMQNAEKSWQRSDYNKQ